MNKSQTPISLLYISLKPHLFSNQVIYYNLLFRFTYDYKSNIFEACNKEINEFIKNRNHNAFLSSKTSKDFYKILLNSTNGIPSSYPSIKTNEATETVARSDVSQAMKKKGESAIPKYWRTNFLRNNKLDLYKSILDTTLKYYILMYHYDKIDQTATKDITTINLQYESWQRISEKLKENELSFNNIDSLEQLENIIVSQLCKQCDYIQQTSLNSQWNFYLSHIESYGEKNIDKLFTLEKYADENVYCAYELATIYYYGCKFITDSIKESIEIKQDYRKAAYYFKQCSQEPNLIVPACWSLGYMYMYNKINNDSNNIDKAFELFTRCGNYPPALNSLGLIYKKRADKVYESKEYNSLTSQEKTECLQNYIYFIEKCYSACCGDWVYAYNNLYAFYIDDKYKVIRKELLHNSSYIELEPITLLQQAANRKNPWAMDTLALHYITDYLWNTKKLSNNCKTNYELFNLVKQGKITLENVLHNQTTTLTAKLAEAKKMLKQLNEINYSRGTFHLAINFYYNSPLMGNLLEKASNLGNEFATAALEDLMKQY